MALDFMALDFMALDRHCGDLDGGPDDLEHILSDRHSHYYFSDTITSATLNRR
jgi:hypothetical protein